MAEKKPIIVIEEQSGGFISNNSQQTIPLEGGEGQYRLARGATTMRAGYEGSLAPCEILGGTSFADSGNLINSVPKAIAVDVSKSTHVSLAITSGASGTAPRLVLSNTVPATLSDSDITPANNFSTLPATGTWGEDIIFYSAQVSVGVYKSFFFYSWNDSGSGDIGAYDIGTPAYDDDYMSTVPASGAKLTAGVPHRMAEGPDKILYITNGQYLASFDGNTGAAGTFNAQALNMGAGWICTDVQYYNSQYIAIIANKMGVTYRRDYLPSESRVILWNGSDLDFSAVIPLNDWFGASLFSKQGLLYIFTQGTNGTTKVKILPQNSPNFQTILEVPTEVIGSAPLPNQVEFFNNAIMWANADLQTVFGITQGQTESGQTTYSVNCFYYLYDSVGAASSVGFIKNMSTNNLYISGNFGGNKITGITNNGLVGNNKIITQTFAQNSIVQYRSKIYDIGYKANIKKVKVYFSSFGSSSSAYMALIPNNGVWAQSGGGYVNDQLAWTINTANHPNIATTMTASTAELGSRSTVATDISRFWLIVDFTNTATNSIPCIIRKIEVYFEPTDKP